MIQSTSGMDESGRCSNFLTKNNIVARSAVRLFHSSICGAGSDIDCWAPPRHDTGVSAAAARSHLNTRQQQAKLVIEIWPSGALSCVCTVVQKTLCSEAFLVRDITRARKRQTYRRVTHLHHKVG